MYRQDNTIDLGQVFILTEDEMRRMSHDELSEIWEELFRVQDECWELIRNTNSEQMKEIYLKCIDKMDGINSVLYGSQ